MKIAVYAIAKNEAQFVERWANSAKEADYILLADTGSTDDTLKIAKRLKLKTASITVAPWRFDDARNASLALLPADIDYCIALDLDEMLIPGWRQALEQLDPAKITRPRYQYTWSWNDDGSPGLQYGGDKIHTRRGYRWKHPVHEVLVCNQSTETQEWIDLQIVHFPDNEKSRSSYLPLLAQSVLEDPYDDRNAFYYARELYFYNNFAAALEEFRRYLNLTTATWGAERAAARRYMAKCEPALAEQHLQMAYDEDKVRRETMVDLAQYYYEKNDWHNCLNWASTSLLIKEKPLDYLCEPVAWGATPYDLAAIASYNLGDKEHAVTYGEKAIELNPTDERLQRNLEFYKS